MPEVSLEELIEEREFALLLGPVAGPLRRLGQKLSSTPPREWTKSQFFFLIHEASSLESYLDDHGARYNAQFSYLRELIASIRWIALAGHSLQHLEGRLGSYQVMGWLNSSLSTQFESSLRGSLDSIGMWSSALLLAIEQEAAQIGLATERDAPGPAEPSREESRRRLPRNVGEADLVNEEQKIASVASRYIEACSLLSELGVRSFDNVTERSRFFKRHCTEANTRVIEATIHNLQSTYDTHIQNTVLESRDERLSKLRGCVSISLHSIEAALYLTHFQERHEDEVRTEVDVSGRLRSLVDPDRLQEIVVNDLFWMAHSVLQAGLPLAEALVPTYTNVTDLRIELGPSVSLHARPAALIVGIVNHHGTPVELQVGEHRCNASSILELLVAVGSNPGERVYTFRGDEVPLADIQLLFSSGLGEQGLESLPKALEYLRSR